MNEYLKVSPNPFVKARGNVNRITEHKILALMAVSIVGICLAGAKSALVMLTSVASAVVFEFLYGLIVNEEKKIENLSCVVTGMIFGCLCAPKTPWYVPIVAMFFATVIIKMMFGGFANNMFSIAGCGQIFVACIFAGVMNSWQVARGVGFAYDPISSIAAHNFDAFNVLDFLVGDVTASIGCMCALAVLIAGAYLALARVIDIKLPLIAVAVYLVTGLCFNGFNINCVLPYLFAGNMLFVSLFLLTDFITRPNTVLGQVLYAAIFGVLSGVFVSIDLCGEMGVIVALIIANCFTPLFDRVIRPRYFGEGKV